MPISDIDFEGTDVQGKTPNSVDNTSNDDVNHANEEDVDHLNGNDVEDVTGKDGNTTDDKTNQVDDNTSTGELSAGDSVEVDGVVYTVSDKGDLVDSKGNVFKEAKDIKEWLQTVNVEDSDSDGSISIATIQEALGVSITDENGNIIEFTNDAEGVNSYVNSVIELKSKELQEAAINKLYSSNPLLKQFEDYLKINGSPRGFGELPDRSGITLDKDNEAQLVAVIKMAAKEFGNKSLNDNYIKYLRDCGGLYDEAKVQLSALVEKDEAVRKNIAEQAQRQREAERKSIDEYWENVSKVIESRKIGSYRIPESFTKEVDGKKIIVTPKDFFNYVSVAKDYDGKSMTGYQADLDKLSNDECLNREILDAWLLFTGGTYKDLIDMAVKEEQVRQLRVKSKEQRSNKSVKIIKDKSKKSSINDIILS